MAETTKITWTDATINFWEGCQHAGAGCDLCYAEARDQRWHAGAHFGPGAPRRRTVPSTFNRPVQWSVQRGAYERAMRERLPMDGEFTGRVPPLWVFAMSLGDFLDNAVDPTWRDDAWSVIRRSPHLRFQIVTKRIGNLPNMLPRDWSDGRNYPHVGFISTICTDAELDRDYRKIEAAKVKYGVRWVGLSVEPMLGPVYISPDQGALDWVICGGESAQGGKKAREFDLLWASMLWYNCSQARIPFHMKQMGSNPFHTVDGRRAAMKLKDRAGADMAEWPDLYQVRQMPRVYDVPRLVA